MRLAYSFILFILCCFCTCKQSPYPDITSMDQKSLCISSDDTSLVHIFNWAIQNSNKRVGSSSDPVGPWYEAALPAREAFCIRDVSHQCIGEEINGHGTQNLNMFTKFVENISESKDWCSYWEINKYNLPAPVDYTSEKDFWYNLNANFDIINACYKLYLWTGNKTYIDNPQFERFFRLSLNEYIDRWQLQADQIMLRPALMNISAPDPDNMRFRYTRGLPSYEESVKGLTVTGDLIAVIYKGFKAYADIQKIKGNPELSEAYEKKAQAYAQLYNTVWWNDTTQNYYAYFLNDKTFKEGGSNMFIPWYGIVKNAERIEQIIQRASKNDTNVEGMSYYPMTYYMYGKNKIAYNYLYKLYTNERRDYPEVASGVIEGIVCGLAGVEPNAAENRISTCPRLTEPTHWIAIENLPTFAGLVSVLHQSGTKTSFANKSAKEIIWRASFPGKSTIIQNGKKEIKAQYYTDALGNSYSYADIMCQPGTEVVAEAINNK